MEGSTIEGEAVGLGGEVWELVSTPLGRLSFFVFAFLLCLLFLLSACFACFAGVAFLAFLLFLLSCFLAFLYGVLGVMHLDPTLHLRVVAFLFFALRSHLAFAGG